MKNYKGVVFFDVDGTLIDVSKGIKNPTEKTKESIKKLNEFGYLTILATGRPMSLLGEELMNLGFSGYIASNGSYAEIENEIIFDSPINNDDLMEIILYFNENKVDYILEGQKENYVYDFKSENLLELIKKVDLEKHCFVDKWEANSVRTNKIIVVSRDEEVYKTIKENYSNKYAFMTHPTGDTFEIYMKKYTKGYGIEQLINKLGISQENTYAFGDGENDIEMFQTVKHGIAMEGYHGKLKDHAYDFTTDVENEGIYEGLKKLQLI